MLGVTGDVTDEWCLPWKDSRGLAANISMSSVASKWWWSLPPSVPDFLFF